MRAPAAAAEEDADAALTSGMGGDGTCWPTMLDTESGCGVVV